MRHTAELDSDRSFAAKLGDRGLFPHLAPLVYVNHAGISPPSRPVRLAMLALLDAYAAQGAAAFPAWFAQHREVCGAPRSRL